MKIITFNVNGIRARLHQLEALIQKHDPEVIGLQEIKVADEDFPVEAIEQLGYHIEFFGQKNTLRRWPDEQKQTGSGQ